MYKEVFLYCRVAILLSCLLKYQFDALFYFILLLNSDTTFLFCLLNNLYYHSDLKLSHFRTLLVYI